MSRKKLLVFHQSLAPYRVDFWNSLNNLFELKLFFAFDNVLIQSFNQEALKRRLQFKIAYIKKGFNLFNRAFRWGLRSIIKDFQPDIIMSQEFSQTTMSLYLLKRIFKFNYEIYTITDDSLTIAIHARGIRKVFRRYLAPRLDGIIFVDPKTRAWCKNEFALRREFLFPIIHNEAVFRPHLQAALPASNALLDKYDIKGKRCIFFVGRLAVEKGLDRLLFAFCKIHERYNDAMLIMIGEGNQRDILTKTAEQLGVEKKLLLPGRTEGNELFAWFNLAPVMVLASQYEPFGAVVNELLLSGADVLCSTNAGAWWLIEPGINGDTFDPYDIDRLCNLLEAQLNKISPAQSIQSIRPSKMLAKYEDYMTQFYKWLTTPASSN